MNDETEDLTDVADTLPGADDVEDLDEVKAALDAAKEKLDEAIARRRAAMREHERRVEAARHEIRRDTGGATT